MDAPEVVAAAAWLGIALTAEKAIGVAEQLQRIRAVAEALDAVELDAMTDEPAPVWRP